ncbi:hypothetical protein EIN_193800 [Entamoeba invadens IP1]|uniref:Leucine rich repeat containing protein BspA family protein n=1 Tax=Entamoeba invadens IP1 TaxID=370355 RepID=A0A0A1U3H7_ENTIV|nr:hypothetical protein EIN_193800 [Entamoeba invadens IP1]ELP88691.1 hypothetical protein EIN_193800 [Entamoeba invadens IP1]|eukprot:XP_004255462.1 hypothetical protein EIN_193800 [Entamoeba invadens IP1]
MSQLQTTDMFNVIKYFHTFTDMCNSILVSKKFKNFISELFENPIPITQNIIKHFPNIKILNLYHENDEKMFYYQEGINKKKYKFDKVVVWYQVSYNVAYHNSNNPKLLFKKISYTVDDSINIGATIPETVNSIGENFYSEIPLNTIEIPTYIKFIGDSCFEFSKNLKTVLLASNIVTIGKNCFANCLALKTVELLNVNKIPDFCFFHCKTLTSVKLPNSTFLLGNSAFSNCESLVQLNIPNDLVSLGESCFSCCFKYTIPILPESFQVQ